MSISYKLNHQFQEKDERDYTYSVKLDEVHNLEIVTKTAKGVTTTTTQPSKTSSAFTIPNLPSIINQGNIGSCTANAFYFTVMQQTKNQIPLSRLFLYANCRCLDNTPLNQDSGTYVRTVCNAILNYGVCKESVYPYITTNFVNLPPLTAYKNSNQFKKFTYTFLAQNVATIKSCLTTYNVPIIFGFMVYSSFMSNTVSTTGVAPMPNTTTETLEGGHCACIVGYDDTAQRFTCVNSWGTSWGNKGYFTIPYTYLTNTSLASDFCFTTFVY
jgi:C1A family cysteine protease